MYRPKFCAECGERILRLRWHLWHSRKFCASCAPRFRKEQAIRLAVSGAMLLLMGISVGYSTRRSPPPVVLVRNQDAHPASSPNAAASAGSTAIMTEDVYLCGARTKKGTPCSRRVHGPVRCWQHKGMPAMLPRDRLLVKD